VSFGLWAQIGPSNHIRWGLDPPWKGVSLRGKGRPIVKYAVSCAKRAELIEMLFGLRTLVGPRKHVLGRGAHCHNLANATDPPCAAVMQLVVKLL